MGGHGTAVAAVPLAGEQQPPAAGGPQDGDRLLKQSAEDPLPAAGRTDTGADLRGVGGWQEDGQRTHRPAPVQSLEVAGPVSYTHLDVYKRQVLDTDDLEIFAREQYAVRDALCLWSDVPELLEGALRAYQGRAFYDGTAEQMCIRDSPPAAWPESRSSFG